ncbi:MAG TPA: signal peptidase I [Parachlamydiales bacterium]|nr:MAG: signal peptidase I [Chlamydiae bacterium RIFCSPHIGHO2_12_FULL_49_32]OGN70856.1 MAG: signal peptidase I [Chlamydiae bacterium RIFCSPLOWO2_12_FULL_49_12]HAZ16124.1 signal peptidase I [Parachlamydiales bacterium]
MFQFASRFKRKKRKLNASQKDQLAGLLFSLQEAIEAKERKRADQLAKKLEQVAKLNLKKSRFQKIRDSLFALGFALLAAIAIRSMWFEFYEIPSGSMRPTFKEQDRLAVSKTDFGINVPLQTAHFYFDPDLVKRNATIIFTGANMDIRDVNTRYFYLFPGKKQYVKRLIGKPGDQLYFYGGLIYGIDRKGQDLLPSLPEIEHIPFIRFEGKVVTPQFPLQGLYSPIVLEQMNEPVAKLYLLQSKQVKGEMVAPGIADYGDLWGIKNFAQVRLLTKEQAKQAANEDLFELPEGELYLEIKHNPSLHNLRLDRDFLNRYRPVLHPQTSFLPLNRNHLETLFHNLYTARFVIKNGFALRAGSHPANNLFLPHLSSIPDGTYEFYNGKAYRILWQGITKELPKDHPLCQFDTRHLQLLFNLGIEWDTRFSPDTTQNSLLPARYAYFRTGDFYLMGAPILKQSDPVLTAFVTRERRKAAGSTPSRPYLPFIDAGPPVKTDGTLDKELIKKYGLLIPPTSYLVLGDNHAMSSDSRDFGFVPEENLRGAPKFIFWPPGSRFGSPSQPGYPLFVTPRFIVWGAALFAALIWTLFRYRSRKLPLIPK